MKHEFDTPRIRSAVNSKVLVNNTSMNDTTGWVRRRGDHAALEALFLSSAANQTVVTVSDYEHLHDDAC